MIQNLSIKQIQHREYLQSPLWRSIRKNAIIHYGEVCGKCGEYGTDVHHLTYERVGGDELIEDLQVLCRDCHEAVHAVDRKSKIHKNGKKSCTLIGLYYSLSKKQKKQIEEKYLVNAYAILTSPSDFGVDARKTAMKMAGIHIIDDNYVFSCKVSIPNKTSKEFLNHLEIAKKERKDIKAFRKQYFSR